jgi:uncharacterized RDD family membrane protein YckC
MTEDMLGGYPCPAYDARAMTSVETLQPDVDPWSSLPYAPRARLAPGGARYAPWWQRLSAFLIDVSAVLTAILTVATPVFVLAGLRHTDVSRHEARLLGFGLLGAGLVVGAAYAIVLEGRSGQTWGKRALGLVVLAEDGSPCGYRRALSRELLGRILIEGISFIFVALPWLLSYISAAWDGERQTWHDRIGQTIVVRVEPPAPSSLTHVPSASTLTV